MSFTDQKPRIATEEETRQPWSGGKNGKYFRCYLCGHKFIPGDQYRFVFGKNTGNLMVCQPCDGTNEEVQDKWDKLHKEFSELAVGKFWYFIERETDAYKEELREAAREEKELHEDREYWKREASYAKQERNW